MSKFSINKVSGNNNVFGDKNNITNNAPKEIDSHVLVHSDYVEIVSQIINIDKLSLEEYLENKLRTYRTSNRFFINILYKYIHTILEPLNNEVGDLLIENGDFVFKDGDIQLTGKIQPNNLHFTIIWLHMQIVEKFSKDDFIQFPKKMDNFEKSYLKQDFRSPEVTESIIKLRSQLVKGKDNNSWSWNDFNEIVNVKPSFMGFGINFNALFEKLFKK